MNAPGNGAPDAMTEINFGLHSAGSAPHAVTEINFGLHSASSGRLVRHDG